MDCADRVYSIPETAGAVTQQIFCAGRARIIVEAILGKPIGEAGSRAMARREWAVHDDTRPSSTHTLWRANLASSAVSRIRCRSHRARARRLKDLPKNCHLLPSTAILPPHNCYDRFNRSNSFLAPQGRAGRPGPGAVNRERGRRHVRNAKPAPPTCTAKAKERKDMAPRTCIAGGAGSCLSSETTLRTFAVEPDSFARRPSFLSGFL